MASRVSRDVWMQMSVNDRVGLSRALRAEGKLPPKKPRGSSSGGRTDRRPEGGARGGRVNRDTWDGLSPGEQAHIKANIARVRRGEAGIPRERLALSAPRRALPAPRYGPHLPY